MTDTNRYFTSCADLKSPHGKPSAIMINKHYGTSKILIAARTFAIFTNTNQESNALIQSFWNLDHVSVGDLFG